MIIFINYYLLPLFLILTACINISEFSLFDITLLPIIISFKLINIFLKKKFYFPENSLIILCYLIFLFSSILGIFESNIIILIGIYLRSILLFIMISLFFRFLANKIDKVDNLSIYLQRLILFTGTILVSISFYQFLFLGDINTKRFNFPFTFEGVDPHLYGLSLISLFAFSIYNLDKNLLKNLGIFEKTIMFSQMFFIAFGAIFTGSRGVLLYGAIALLPKSTKTLYLIISKGKLNKTIFYTLIISVLLISFLVSTGLLGNLVDRFINLFTRILSISNLLAGTDQSRSLLIESIIQRLGTLDTYTFLGKAIKTTLEDSGLMFYLLNFGLIGLILYHLALLSIGFPKLLFIRNYLKTSFFTKSHILSIVLYNIVSSESLVIPRCAITVAFSTACFLCLDYSKLVKRY